jgi:ligand-binding sensor protein/AraC-like DNA-binding protein
MAELRIGSLLDLDHLQRVLEGFSEATGLATVTVDARGLPVTPPCAFTDFCKKMRADPVRSKLCRGCDAHGGLQAVIDGSPHVYRCHAGLVDFSVPVMAGETYLGTIACGQIRMPQGEEPAYLTSGPSSWLGDPEMEALYEQVPVMSRSRVRAAAQTMQELRVEFDDSASSVRLRQLLPLTPTTPAPLREEPGAALRLAAHPADEPATGTPSSGTPADTVSLGIADAVSSTEPDASVATDLRTAMDSEDLAGAIDAIGILLDTAHSSQSEQRERVAAIEDLIVDIAGDCCPRIVPHLSAAVQRTRTSRAARRTRYDNQLYLEKLLTIVLDDVQRSRPQRRRDIRDLLNDIARHPTRSLTLTEAASRMHLSPGHLSKLFKSVTGCTFVSYVTERRIARARLMLASTEMPVQRIATELDFNQVNYFSRVFRSYTGVSPSAYRRDNAARDGRPTGAPVPTHHHDLLRA